MVEDDGVAKGELMDNQNNSEQILDNYHQPGRLKEE